MQLDIEELGPVRRRATIEVPAPGVDSAFSSAYNKVAQRAAVPGFRRGKVPMSHLKQRYGRQITSEVTQDFLDQGLRRLIDEHALKILGRPDVDVQPARQGHPFTATLTFEIAPHVELLDPGTYTVSREKWIASDAVVEHELEHVAERFARLEAVEGRTTAEKGDVVTLDYRGELDEIPFPGGTAQDAQLELGSGRFIPGFEDKLIGHAVGESFAIDVTFPEAYPAQNLAGKAVVFHVTLKKLERQVLPQVDDDLAVQIGFGSLDELKTRLKADIERHHDERANADARVALRAEIGRAYDFEVPPLLLESALQDKKMELVREARGEGKDTEEARAHAESAIEDHRAEILADARAEIVIDQIGDDEKIDVTPRELNAYIEQLVRQMGQYAEQIRQMYQDPNRRAGLRRRIRQDKVLDFLLTKANVTTVEKDVPMHDHSHDGHDHDAHEHDGHDHEGHDHHHDAEKDAEAAE
ncbi:MAG: trigger factor [Myxococcales bacterium]|nr:trigger factor [Myxococcales bacterium]